MSEDRFVGKIGVHFFRATNHNKNESKKRGKYVFPIYIRITHQKNVLKLRSRCELFFENFEPTLELKRLHPLEEKKWEKSSWPGFFEPRQVIDDIEQSGFEFDKNAFLIIKKEYKAIFRKADYKSELEASTYKDIILRLRREIFFVENLCQFFHDRRIHITELGTATIRLCMYPISESIRYAFIDQLFMAISKSDFFLKQSPDIVKLFDWSHPFNLHTDLSSIVKEEGLIELARLNYITDLQNELHTFGNQNVHKFPYVRFNGGWILNADIIQAFEKFLLDTNSRQISEKILVLKKSLHYFFKLTSFSKNPFLTEKNQQKRETGVYARQELFRRIEHLHFFQLAETQEWDTLKFF